MTGTIPEKSKEQKLAIARMIQIVLIENERKLGTTWTAPWWQKVMTYLQFTPEEKGTFSTISSEKAISQLTTPKDIRIDVLLDLLSVALNIDQTTLKDGDHPKEIIYDARARHFLYLLTKAIGLEGEELMQVERSLGQQLYFTLQEQTKKDGNHDHTSEGGGISALMNDSAQKTMEETNNKKKLYRWLATGAGFAVGGGLIALTGGLAAPLLAPILVGITGATFFASAAGVVLVTSLFGLTEESTWIEAFKDKKQINDTYCLEYETNILLDLGYAFRKFITNQALKYAGLEVAKQTALAAFFTAIALPAALMKVSDIIDDPWQLAVDRSKKAGLELQRRKVYGAIDNVVLLGAPIPSDEIENWHNVLSVVSGRFVNGYTPDDWVLAYCYRLHSLETKVSGLGPVIINGVENVPFDLEGHTSYPTSLKEIMSKINV
ncbi:hypothetical protein BJ944DRAFT_256404 [Cunninghamella echinulata]|nr:hypothetical protein BJ944DRAFT_256404 [Cunninghamella echinulata]